MSAHPLHAAASDGHDHVSGSRRGYWIGCLLAVVLTVVPFRLVMARVLPDPGWTAGALFALALAQIVIHVVSFLHLDARSENGWTLLAFLFTAVIVVITIGGSVWVMFHLNTNMMPMPGGVAGPVH